MFLFNSARNLNGHRLRYEGFQLLALTLPTYRVMKLQQRDCKSTKCDPPQKKSRSEKGPCGPVIRAKEEAATRKKEKMQKEIDKYMKEKSKMSGLKRIRYWQARFQCADGLPVFLKLGGRDKLLYYTTLGLTVTGLICSFYTYITLIIS